MKKNSIVIFYLLLFAACSKKDLYVNYRGELIDSKHGKKIMLDKKLSKKDAVSYIFDDSYIVVSNNRIFVINKDNGKIKEKTLNNRIISKISMDENFVYLLTADNRLYYLDKNTLNVDFIHYESIESTIINDLAPIIYKNYLIVLFNNGKIVVFDRIAKKVKAEKYIEKNEIVNSENVVFKENKVVINDSIELNLP